MDMGFPAERTLFPGVHRIGAAISGPRIADKNFTDTRIFSEKGSAERGFSDLLRFVVIRSGKTDPVQFKGRLKQGLIFAYESGRFVASSFSSRV